jgi:hypothetical protein
MIFIRVPMAREKLHLNQIAKKVNENSAKCDKSFLNMDIRFSASRRISHRLRAGRPQTDTSAPLSTGDGRGPPVRF